jgi:heme-degrading monooxygenase HmoA
MIAVILEVVPRGGRKNHYLAIAADLRAELEATQGFISVERFESLSRPEKILSLSFWRDEESVARWRRTAEHCDAQLAGCAHILEDYRIQVARVVREHGMTEPSQTPVAQLVKRLRD